MIILGKCCRLLHDGHGIKSSSYSKCAKPFPLSLMTRWPFLCIKACPLRKINASRKSLVPTNPTIFGPQCTQLMLPQYPTMSCTLMPAVILETEGGIFFSNGKRLRLQWSSVSAQQEGDSCRATAVRSVIQQCLSFSVLLRLWASRQLDI